MMLTVTVLRPRLQLRLLIQSLLLSGEICWSRPERSATHNRVLLLGLKLQLPVLTSLFASSVLLTRKSC